MPLDSPPILTIQQALAFKLETTTGTAATLANADAVDPIFDPKIDFDDDQVDRPGFGTLSPSIQGRGATSGTATFAMELTAGGSGTPPLINMFKCCGMDYTAGVITPDYNMQTATIASYQGGRRKMLAGCQGNPIITVRRGESARVAFTFKGVPESPDDETILVPTSTQPVGPRAGVSTLTVGSQDVFVDQLEIDFGMQVVMREDIAAANADGYATGYRSAIITSRKPVIRLAPEAQLLSVLDWFASHRDRTTIALSFTIGSDTGNTWAFSFPKLDVAKQPGTGDRNGMMTDTVELVPTKNSTAGDDEWSITLS